MKRRRGRSLAKDRVSHKVFHHTVGYSKHKLKTSKQQFLDRFSRELDAIEAKAPMQGSYERIKPYIVDHQVGGQDFEFIIYHKESESWFGGNGGDASLQMYKDYQTVKPGDVCFDIGCNSGYISVWLGLAVGPQGKVLAFDPYPWNALATNYSARLNYLENVRAYPIGLSDQAFELKLQLNSARTLEASTGNQFIMAHIANIQEFVSERPTFMKIDIEGGEYELTRTNWANFDRLERIFLELHPFYIDDRGLEPRAVLKNLAGAGFSMAYGHPQAAIVDANTCELGHGGWFLTRPITPAS